MNVSTGIGRQHIVGWAGTSASLAVRSELLQRVLRLAESALDLARHLVLHAFGNELLVPGDLPGSFLDYALCLLRRACDSIVVHGSCFLCFVAMRIGAAAAQTRFGVSLYCRFLLTSGRPVGRTGLARMRQMPMNKHVSAPELKSVRVIALATYRVRPQSGIVIRSCEKIFGVYKNADRSIGCVARTQEVTTVFDHRGHLVLLRTFYD